MFAFIFVGFVTAVLIKRPFQSLPPISDNDSSEAGVSRGSRSSPTHMPFHHLGYKDGKKKAFSFSPDLLLVLLVLGLITGLGLQSFPMQVARLIYTFVLSE